MECDVRHGHREASKRLGELDGFPVAVRAGPYFVRGAALAHHQASEDAALDLLRVPFLYPEDRPLAAAALFEAARSLETAGQVEAAVASLPRTCR